MPFETCCAERVVTLSGRVYRVEAPPFGLGLQVLYALENLNDDDDKRFLYQTLVKLNWTSEFILPHLRIAYEENPLLFRSGIYKLVTQGYEVPKTISEKLKKEEDEPKIPTWSYLLARYCETYHVAPHEVWFNTPFSLFLQMNKEVEGVRYRRRIETTMGVGAGMGGVDEEETKKWTDIAYKTRFDEDVKEVAQKEVDYRAELEREREMLKNRL